MNAPLNLPSLPATHFWRVTETSFHMDEVQLRRRLWFFSIKVDDALIFFYKTVDGERVGVYDPKSAIEDSALRLHHTFMTGKPGYQLRLPTVAHTPIPGGVSLTQLEKKFDAVYAGYRKSHSGFSVQEPGAACSPAAAGPGR